MLQVIPLSFFYVKRWSVFCEQERALGIPTAIGVVVLFIFSLPNNHRSATTGTVSYTHLDVYKRQRSGRLWLCGLHRTS